MRKILILAILSGCSNANPTDLQKEVDTLKAQIETIKQERMAQEDADTRLGQFAINAMYKTSAKNSLSGAKKQVLAQSIVRVSNSVFNTEDQRQAFIMVLSIESAFQRLAQSPTGPKGYSQVAKSAFKEGMAECGVTELNDEDVWETEINLYAGACYFKKMLTLNNNNPYMASIAYNQGLSSSSVKSYKADGTLNEIEPLKYVSKFSFLKDHITDEKSDNIPPMSGLPTISVKQ